MAMMEREKPIEKEEKDKEEVQKIISMINEANPKILIVGLGCPKQEKFIHKYRKELNVPISLGLGARWIWQELPQRLLLTPKWL